jgi:hypothetical protein
MNVNTGYVKPLKSHLSHPIVQQSGDSSSKGRISSRCGLSDWCLQAQEFWHTIGTHDEALLSSR